LLSKSNAAHADKNQSARDELTLGLFNLLAIMVASLFLYCFSATQAIAVGVTPQPDVNVNFGVCANIAGGAGNATLLGDTGRSFDQFSFTINLTAEFSAGDTITFSGSAGISNFTNSFVVDDTTGATNLITANGTGGRQFTHTVTTAGTRTFAFKLIILPNSTVQRTITATCKTGSGNNTRGITQSYVSGRLGQMSNMLTEILDHERFLNEEGGPKPGFSLSGNGTNIAFAGSLSGVQALASRSSAVPRPMAVAPMKPAATSPRKFDAWFKGAYTSFDDDTANASHDGHTGIVIAGAHYNVNDTLLIGALAAHDTSEWNSNQLNAFVDGDGWLVGGYLRKRFDGEAALSLTATWGRSDNDIRDNGATGSFDTDRFLFIGNYWNTWRKGPRRISGNAGVIYAHENIDAYTLSSGTAVASQSVKLGRLFFGPEVAYKFTGPRIRTIEPLVWVRGIWDFESEGRITIGNTASINKEQFYGQVGGGLHLAITDKISGRFTVQYDGLGAGDYRATTLQGRINIPLN